MSIGKSYLGQVLTLYKVNKFCNKRILHSFAFAILYGLKRIHFFGKTYLFDKVWRTAEIFLELLTKHVA